VLIVNNFFSNVGGAENSTYRTGRLLSARGHDVWYFATDKGPLFEPNYVYTRFFPAYTDYNALSFPRSLALLQKPFYNFEARRNIAAMIEEVSPDVVHLNGIVYQLTPSVIAPCVRRDIPVVMTLRDAFLFCPSIAMMFRAQRYCRDEYCVKGSALNCIRYRCVDGRLVNSVVAAAEFLFRRAHRLYDKVVLFICTSEAMFSLARRSGISEHRLTVISNFVEDTWLSEAVSPTDSGYFLYAGRLTREKGIGDLIRAAALVPDIQVRIVGRGPMSEAYTVLARKLGADNVHFAGFKTGEALIEEFLCCTAVVMPSDYFEAFGLTAIEAYSYGKPVIGARVGGIPETVEQGVSGLLFSPGDHRALAECMRYLHVNRAAAAVMGGAGRRKVCERYNAGAHYEKLIRAYGQVIG
jgi:glycosyltransferase involved in cell wall biosynthesis